MGTYLGIYASFGRSEDASVRPAWLHSNFVKEGCDLQSLVPLHAPAIAVMLRQLKVRLVTSTFTMARWKHIDLFHRYIAIFAPSPPRPRLPLFVLLAMD